MRSSQSSIHISVTRAEFHPVSEGELLAAARYYESQAENLGLEFISAVEATNDHICQFPDSGRPFGQRLRRFLVRRFPYTVVHHAEPGRVLREENHVAAAIN